MELGGVEGNDTRETVSNNSLICSENTKEGEPTLITVLLAKSSLSLILVCSAAIINSLIK